MRGLVVVVARSRVVDVRETVKSQNTIALETFRFVALSLFAHPFRAELFVMRISGLGAHRVN